MEPLAMVAALTGAAKLIKDNAGSVLEAGSGLKETYDKAMELLKGKSEGDAAAEGALAEIKEGAADNAEQLASALPNADDALNAQLTALAEQVAALQAKLDAQPQVQKIDNRVQNAKVIVETNNGTMNFGDL